MLIYFYNINPKNYSSGLGVLSKNITKMHFDNTIYGDATVKAQLKIDQHNKCCFWESKFTDTSYGDVEHFRPKKAYKKNGAKSLTYPGYYWLAYNWNNLLFSCEICNRKYKRNEFPLDNELTRKPFHSHPNLLSNEDRLLINPIEDNPSDYITFKEEIPIPKNGSRKGATSIKVFGLERLNESRLENLKAIKSALTFLNVDETNIVEVNSAAFFFKIKPADLIELINSAKTLYNSVAKDTAKFSLCVRCNFPNLPIN